MFPYCTPGRPSLTHDHGVPVIMVLFRLHVWGPAFGLASIDAECLATITYLANALQADLWELVEIVATSPSGVPTREFS